MSEYGNRYENKGKKFFFQKWKYLDKYIEQKYIEHIDIKILVIHGYSKMQD